MIDLKNILLPTDFSDSSLTATRYAIELSKRFSATLHVIEDPGVYIAAFDSFPLPSPVEFETYAEERLENWILADDAAGGVVGNGHSVPSASLGARRSLHPNHSRFKRE